MNIFYLDRDPVIAASYMYDKHKVKMILESAQMLCTAHRYYGNEDVPYKTAHLNHPSSIWCRQSIPNYMGLYNHMIALGKEYTKRYGKEHLTIIKCKEPLSVSPEGIDTYASFTEPPQCMPDEFKRSNAIHGYWRYYIIDKRKICNKNEIPYTFKTIPTDVMDKYYSGICSFS